MNPQLISIGKMAEMNHISIPTLRLYDRLGLLRPRYVDEETGYRYYDMHQNARLDMIAYMKELGMSLTEIGGGHAGDARPARSGCAALCAWP